MNGDTRVVDLTARPVGTHYEMLPRGSELELILPNRLSAADRFFHTKMTERWVVGVGYDGKMKYRLRPNDYYRNTNGFVLLLDMVSAAGHRLHVYLNENGYQAVAKTVVHQPENVGVIVGAFGILEIIVTEPSYPLAIPAIDTTTAKFRLNFIRREVVSHEDPVMRLGNNVFDICRIKQRSVQTHYFYQIDPNDLDRLAREPNGHAVGPTIMIPDVGAYGQYNRTVRVLAPVNDNFRQELTSQWIRERATRLRNEGAAYGLGPSFGGATTMMDESIIVKPSWGSYAIAEVAHPVRIDDQLPRALLVVAPDYTNHRLEVRPNGYRVVNNVYFQVFKITSRPGDEQPPTSPSYLGTVSFYHGQQYIPQTLTVFAQPTAATQPAAVATKPRTIASYFDWGVNKKPRVARSVTLHLIPKSPLITKIADPGVRIVNNPADGETLYLFDDEKVYVRFTRHNPSWPMTRWQISSQPTFLSRDGFLIGKDYEEYRFKILPSHYRKNTSKIVFTGKGEVRTINIGLIR